ncbi:flagellar basal body P-ring formation chaperone FlgA [Pseudoduganella namucuonensis]|uniref:Flagella basal body P-ring formation protein FlgA n=1 Tax=Pseudoduganella namucuonensis TaxID=1035707 RepID=A0A1I7M473_9BURK|nr:flagellar basal body P-ring formation chaperone FlgA [Pseudoduganella namucuonensis]SFV16667.1 flagella basal body P-ring formation protein FlgA [Pseudoduganella namucuonensis]
MTIHLALRLLPACGLACAAQAWAAEIVLDLRDEVLLAQPRARLADVARVHAPDAALRQALEALPVASAPLAGQVERRSRIELEAALKGQPAMRGHSIAWQGAAGVRMRTESVALDGARLAEAAGDHLRQHYGAGYERFEARPVAAVPDVAVPVGPLRLVARPLDRPRPAARVAVWVDVLVRDTVYRSVVVPMSVAAWRQVYVAKRAASEGAAAAGDFEWRARDVAALADDPAEAADLAPGARLRQPVAPGQILLRKQLAPGGMVLRGERVRLLAGADGIRIETSAVAEADAALGQPVKVRPGADGAAVMARVTAPGVVSLEER